MIKVASRKFIVDLSSFQSTKTVNDYKNISADYAIIKISESTNYVNPYIRTLINRSAGAGVKGFAFYHFGRFTNDYMAIQEANYFIQNAKATVNPAKGTLMILDAEITNMPTSSVIKFLQVLKNAGYKTGFYTYKYLLPDFNLKAIKPYMDFFWIAAYPTKVGNRNPDFNYFPSADYVDLWQYTDNYENYNVDMSITVTDRAERFFNPATPTKEETKKVSTPAKSKKESFVDDIGDTWIKEDGTFTAKQNLFLRYGAKDKSKHIATVHAGDAIDYDAYSDHDGYRWLRQPRSNGTYGYLPCRNNKSMKYFGKFSYK